MSEFRITSRYAKSLIDLAKEQNNLDAVFSDIKQFISLLHESSALENMLKNPIIKSDKKLSILKILFDKSFNKLSMLFIENIVRKRREPLLGGIASQFISQYNDYNKITTATVRTAVETNDATKDQIKKYLEKQSGKSVELKSIVDADLIGGLIVQLGDKKFDASIAGSLRQAKKELINTYISN